jgi:hypothetical protein
MNTKLVLTIILMAFGPFLMAQDQQPVLRAKERIHDFGNIQQGRPVVHQFELINTGKDSISIASVVASCGCTTPTWSKLPIPPGGKTTISVGYNSAAPGRFEKPITIFYGDEMIELAVKGNVYTAPPTPAPENASIQFLKRVAL